MKDNEIAQLVSKITNDLHKRIPGLPESLRVMISVSVVEYFRSKESDD